MFHRPPPTKINVISRGNVRKTQGKKYKSPVMPTPTSRAKKFFGTSPFLCLFTKFL